MNIKLAKALGSLLIGGTFGLLSCSAYAAYPDKPIRLVVGFSPGPAADYVARTIAQSMSDKFRQSVVVENRAGANGGVATGQILQAKPDGYTLYLTSIGHVVNPLVYTSQKYDPVNDFSHIGLVANFPNVWVMGAKQPFNTVQELTAYARQNPGKVSYGSSGYGSSAHLAGELYKQTANVDLLHIPYSSGMPYTDVIAGEVSIAVPPMVSAMSLLQNPNLKALAVTSSNRSSIMKDVPSMAESGVADYETGVWYALIGPAGMPDNVVAALSQGLDSVLQDPAVSEKLKSQGATLGGAYGADLTSFFERENVKWTRVIDNANIKKMD